MPPLLVSSHFSTSLREKVWLTPELAHSAALNSPNTPLVHLPVVPKYHSSRSLFNFTSLVNGVANLANLTLTGLGDFL